jgi:predicted small lipoprotein YifL
MKFNANVLCAVMLSTTVGLGLAACEKKGPLEQAAEEIDEAVDTLRRGGEESTSNKIDDAIDEAREGASDAVDELKDN